MTGHKRDEDPESSNFDHFRINENHVAGIVRNIVFVIERVGIQGAVICALLYICFVTLGQVKTESAVNSLAIVTALEKNTVALRDLRHFLTKKYDD